MAVAGCATNSAVNPHTGWTAHSEIPYSTAAETSLRARARAIDAVPDTSTESTPVPLTRDEALLTALATNPDIVVSRYGPRLADTYIGEARAAFDPSLTGALSYSRDNQPIAESQTDTLGVTTGAGTGSANTTQAALQLTLNALRAAQGIVSYVHPEKNILESRQTQGTLALREYLPTGTELTLSGSTLKSGSNQTEDSYQGAIGVELRQALLRGFGTKVNLASLRQARNSSLRQRYEFMATALDTVRRVESGYWDLVLAHEVEKIREFGVRLAEEQLQRNEDLLAVGRAIDADVLASRAERDTRVADAATAKASTRSRNVELLRLLNPGNAGRLDGALEPVDEPGAEPALLSLEDSQDLAARFRPEIAQAQCETANADLEVVSARNNLLPAVDLVAAYGRSSRGSGSGGLTSSWNDKDYENYRIGVEVNLSLLNRAEKARHTRAQLTRAQMERSIERLRLDVAAEVRQAVIEVERQWESLHASRQAVASREEQYRVEKGRNEVGKTTNLDLVRVQRDLIEAQVAEATARIQYEQALTALYAAEGTLLLRRGIAFEDLEE